MTKITVEYLEKTKWEGNIDKFDMDEVYTQIWGDGVSGGAVDSSTVGNVHAWTWDETMSKVVGTIRNPPSGDIQSFRSNVRQELNLLISKGFIEGNLVEEFDKLLKRV